MSSSGTRRHRSCGTLAQRRGRASRAATRRARGIYWARVGSSQSGNGVARALTQGVAFATRGANRAAGAALKETVNGTLTEPQRRANSSIVPHACCIGCRSTLYSMADRIFGEVRSLLRPKCKGLRALPGADPARTRQGTCAWRGRSLDTGRGRRDASRRQAPPCCRAAERPAGHCRGAAFECAWLRRLASGMPRHVSGGQPYVLIV